MGKMNVLRKLLKGTLLAVSLGFAVWGVKILTTPAYDGKVGFTTGTTYSEERQRNIKFHIWYPAKPDGRRVTIGGNGVFYGTPAGRNAPAAAGMFPVVIISHGAGGNAGQFGWIAAALAAEGYVVVLPNHPGTTSRNASAKAAVRVWERPRDISVVIDTLNSAPENYPFADTTRITALGFSAGGYTAMAVSGARVDPAALQGFCDDGDHGMSDCAFLARAGIDLHAMDLSPAAQDLRDPRIQAAIIIDPGIIETLTADSLSEIDIPMLLINLGAEDTIPAGVYARAAAAIIPDAEYVIVPDAIHFSFLAQCKDRGATILRKEGETDPLCDDAGGRTRSAIHTELKGIITDYLKRVVWPNRAETPL